MRLEQLKSEMEERSVEDIRHLRETSERKAESMRKEAFESAEGVKAQHMERAFEAVERERTRQLYDAAYTVKKDSRLEKNRLFDEVFRQALDELERVRDTPVYKELFRQLLEEAVETLDTDRFRLHIDKRDETLCRETVDAIGLQCEILSDITCYGGMNASSADGRIRVLNTLESRLEQSRDVLRLDIFSALFGD